MESLRVFSFLPRLSTPACGLFLLAFSAQAVEFHNVSIPAPTTVGSPTSSGVPTAAERPALDAETKEVREFSARLLNRFGCDNFESAAFATIVQELKNTRQPQLSKENHAKAMIESLRTYNRSDVPDTLLDGAKSEFAVLMRVLSNILSGKIDEPDFEVNLNGRKVRVQPLFKYYWQEVEPTHEMVSMSSYDVGNNLKSENTSTRVDTPKKIIQEILARMNVLRGKEKMNIGCELEPQKNTLMVTSDIGLEGLHDYLRRKAASPKVAAIKVIPKVEAPATAPEAVYESPRRLARRSPPSTATERARDDDARPDAVDDSHRRLFPVPPASIPHHRRSVEGYASVPGADNNDRTSRRTDTAAETHRTPSTRSAERDVARSDIPAGKVNVGDHAGVVKKYLSLGPAQMEPFMSRGWHDEYEDFLEAFIQESGQGLLRNFSRFSEVCDGISYYAQSPERKLFFLKKFFKAIASVETAYDPRIEMRENSYTQYLPKSKEFPSVSQKAFVQHSVGMWQLDERDYFSPTNCREIDYEHDAAIGYPSSRVRKTPWTNKKGVPITRYVEYYGDQRKTILNPFVNAACAVRIMESKLSRYGIFSEKSYWACFRPGARDREKFLEALKREVPHC